MDYSNKTREELIAVCKEKIIKGYSRKKKQELIIMIQQHNDSPIVAHIATPVLIKKTNIEVTSQSIKTEDMTTQEYATTIAEIESVAKIIGVERTGRDGRIDSAMKEIPFLNEMKRLLLEKHPDWEIDIPPLRASYDIIINSIRINLKLTDCKSSDNSVSKPAIYHSITGLTTYPNSSNWNKFLDKLNDAKNTNNIKKQRHKPSEYHYLVKNKLSGDVLFKPIFDIHTYVSNASNDLQINWKNEFASSEYHTKDEDYGNKVKSLVKCIQKSVQEMIDRTKRFAEADVDELFS